MKMRLNLLLFSFMCLPALSQVMKFRHITVEDGLPTNTVFGFAQDSLGFIWIATVDGICRYDGRTLRVFRNDPDDSLSLHYDAIRFIYVDAQNHLWCGAKGGLSRYNPVTGKFHFFPVDSAEKGGVNRLNTTAVVGAGGKIYVGTLGGGINVYDPATQKFTAYIHHKPGDPASIPSDNIRSMTADKNGLLWVATLDAGMFSYDPGSGKCSRYTSVDGLPSNEMRNIYAARDGRIWVSCWSQGISVFDPVSGKFRNPRDSSQWFNFRPWGLVSQFCEDRQGRIWFATAEHGIGFLDEKNGLHEYMEYVPEDPHSIGDKTVFCVMEDRSGVIWAGTWNGGVNIYDPKAHIIKHFRIEPGKKNTLNSNVVWRILKQSSGNYLVGTSKFINTFDPAQGDFGQLPYFPGDENSPGENTIAQALFEDSEGKLWIGSNGAGVYRYDPLTKKYRQYRPSGDSNSFGYHTVLHITEDLNRDVWFTTSGGGLCRYNRDKDNFSQFYNIPGDTNTIRSDYIFYMLLRKDGHFWLATDKGLDLFSPVTGKAKHFRSSAKDSTTITIDAVTSLAYGKGGILWVGTGLGMCSYDEGTGKFTRYTESAYGFPATEVRSIVEDRKGVLWVGTGEGLFLFNPATRYIRKLEPADGLQSREFGVNCFFMDEAGRIYGGGVNGFNVFDPEEVRENPVFPRVVFTDLTVLNKPWSLPQTMEHTKEVVLSHREYFFSLYFAALEFSDPSRNRFRYFLEGLTTDWVDLGTNHFVTFTNLDPGEYVLKVQACNNHGVWNETPAELRIIITPPFYRTTWFYTLCAIMTITGIYIFIKWRERKLKSEKAHLENVVAVRTSELREEKEKVDAAHKDIRDSINYAKRIQEATLPLAEEIEEVLPGSFVLFKPRDVVSGDFYWFFVPQLKQKGIVYLAAADCTGHGVPGALMSMIGSSALNRILSESPELAPGDILTRLNEDIRTALKQNMADSETRDGMDIALVRLDTLKRTLLYAGANRPLYYIRKDIPEMEEIRADKYPIGGSGNEKRSFVTHTLELNPGDTFYVFSDGYPDQFGGDPSSSSGGKKLMIKNFRRMLMLYNHLPIAQIGKKLYDEFETWKGMYEQVDDVLVIGVRV